MAPRPPYCRAPRPTDGHTNGYPWQSWQDNAKNTCRGEAWRAKLHRVEILSPDGLLLLRQDVLTARQATRSMARAVCPCTPATLCGTAPGTRHGLARAIGGACIQSQQCDKASFPICVQHVQNTLKNKLLHGPCNSWMSRMNFGVGDVGLDPFTEPKPHGILRLKSRNTCRSQRCAQTLPRQTQITLAVVLLTGPRGFLLEDQVLSNVVIELRSNVQNVRCEFTTIAGRVTR